MRRIFTYFLIAAGLIALIIIFFPNGGKGTQFGQAELPDDVKKHLIGKWKWKSTVDPFDKSNKRLAEVEGQEYLAINEDGTFIEWSKEQSKNGIWILNKKQTAIALVYGQDKKRLNKMASSLLTYEYRHRIKKLDQEELILGVQGRHGIVETSYKSIPKEEWENLVSITR